MKLIGKAYFPSGARRHYLEVYTARGLSEDNHAYVEYHYGRKPSVLKRGRMVFDRRHLTLPLIVHECVHGGMCFAEDMVMTSEAVKVMPDEEARAYWDEVVPRLTEGLFAQVAPLLIPSISL